jgi:hypothetical protein
MESVMEPAPPLEDTTTRRFSQQRSQTNAQWQVVSSWTGPASSASHFFPPAHASVWVPLSPHARQLLASQTCLGPGQSVAASQTQCVSGEEAQSPAAALLSQIARTATLPVGSQPMHSTGDAGHSVLHVPMHVVVAGQKNVPAPQLEPPPASGSVPASPASSALLPSPGTLPPSAPGDVAGRSS